MRILTFFCLVLITLSSTAQTTPLTNPNLSISCPYDIIFVLDESGSISGVGSADDISGIVRTAALDLITALNGSGSRVAVIEFNSEARRANIGVTTDYQTVNAAYITAFSNYLNDADSSASTNNYDPEDYSSADYWTNWEAAFDQVQNINSAPPLGGGLAKLVIFFTDGDPTAFINAQGGITEGTGASTVAQALDEATISANAVKTQGSHIFVVGLPNTTLNEANVQHISGPDRYPDLEASFIRGDYSVSTSQTLQNDLERIALSVCKIDLNLTKTVDDPTPCSGDTVTFSLTLSNDGLDNATDITIEDVIPNGYIYLGDNGGASTSFSGTTLTWTLDSLIPGNPDSIHIFAQVNNSGNYQNIAKVTGYLGDDIDSTNNQDTLAISFLLNCDDEDPCTIDFCVNGACVYDTICCLSNAECEDSLSCTIDTCIQGVCFNLPQMCNDGNPCTVDSCIDGECVSTEVVCDDKNPCTIDECVEGECFFSDTICDLKFKCDRTFYMTQYNNASPPTAFFKINIDNVVTFSQQWVYNNNTVNSIGYNRIDNLIYGFDVGTGDVFRFFSDGSLVSLGKPPIPNTAHLFAGDVDRNGIYVLTGDAAEIHRIDVSSYPAVVLSSTTKFYTDSIAGIPNFGDIIFHPQTNVCYGVDRNRDYLATIDPLTGGVTIFGGIQTETGIGGLFFDAFGTLYGYSNNQLWEIDLENATITLITSGPSGNGRDGCSCPYSIDFTKRVTPGTTCPGDTVVYTFTIANATGDTISGVNFVDVLDPNLTIINNPNNLLDGNLVGGTGFGTNLLSISGMTLEADTSSFTISAVISTSFTGTLSNQALLTGNLSAFGDTIFSDDPTTVPVDDSTVVNVVDNIAPDAVCTDITIQLDPSGNASLDPGDLDGGSSDNCATNLDLALINAGSFTCTDAGQIFEILLVVTDNVGNSDTCLALVTVIDTLCNDQDLCTVDFCDGADCFNEPVLLSNFLDTTVCPGTTVELTPELNVSLGNQSYLWSTGETTAAILATDSGTYSFTVTATGNLGDTIAVCSGTFIVSYLLCDDGIACTIDECINGICVFTDTICEDQDPCTIDKCINGICVFTDTICDDQNPCTIDECINGICFFTDTICEDQNPCTIDECVNGICVFTDTICDDQNLCTIDECINGICVFTDTICDDQNPCTTDECINGICVFTNIICDDGIPCTIDECIDGICTSRDTVCDDLNPCTTDECINGICVFTDKICNDLNPCTIDECINGICISTDTICDDQNPCTIDECFNGVCLFTDTICDDQNPCTIDECIGGICVSRDTICNDQNPCTIDECINGICVFTDTICNDQNLCTIDECINGVCLFTDLICDDQNPCTIDSCIDGICTFTEIICNDQNPCTIDECINGLCVFTDSICDDQDPCTLDSCLNGVCVFTAIICDDENPCTIDTCINGACIFTQKDCADRNSCTLDTCINGTCMNIPIICNDNNPCTTDSCIQGICAFFPKECDDGDPCTTDECINGNCVFTNIICDDGDLCTTDECVNGLCVYTPMVCNDNNPCTEDSCANGQCIFTPKVCDDNNPCTEDICLRGKCIFLEIVCEDQDPCTIDTCMNGVCAFPQRNCDDGDPCTIDECLNGICVYTVSICNDNNPCTIDECINGVCVFTDSICDDQNPCTLDECINGECVSTTIICDDQNPCTIDECINSLCVFTEIGCDDGDPCTIDFCENGICLHECEPVLNSANDIQWQKPLGGRNNDGALGGVRQTTDGGYIVSGYTWSSNANVSGHHGFSDFWVTKLDATGNLQWQNALGGNKSEFAYSVWQTTDGGYVLAGSATTSNGDVSGTHGDKDFWVVKLNAAGSLQWQKALGGQWADEAHSIKQTTDGGYIVAGWTSSNNGDVSGNHGRSDYWVVKLDAAGNITWQKTLGGSSIDKAYAVDQTADGGYIVAGSAASNNGDVSGGHGNEDYWVVKLNAAGNLVWQKALGGSNNDVANAVQQTNDGGYIVAGYTTSNNGDVSNNHGSQDYWVVKLNAGGNLIWQKTLGGSGQDQANSVDQTTDGGYLVAGGSRSNNGDVSENKGNYDFWLVMLDGSGNILWEKSLGGNSQDIAYSAMQTTDKGVVVAGISASYNNGDVNGSKGGNDFWVVKLASNEVCVPTSETTLIICAGDSILINGNYEIMPGIYFDTIPVCDDDNPCTIDECGPAGCIFTARDCNDDNPCTYDICVDGICSNTPIVCFDDDLCTIDSCVNGTCFFPALCIDNDPCTYDICIDGVCSFPQVDCDDGNPCTLDQCDNGNCTYTPINIQANLTATNASCGCNNENDICELDFAGLPAGTILSEQYAAYGIHISAIGNFPGQDAAIIFNTGATGTSDPDLQVNIGNLMIIAENLVDFNPVDGLADKPNDNREGGIITINFDQPRTIESFVYVDEEEGSYAVAYNGQNQPIATVPIPPMGDGSIQTVPVNTAGVWKLEFVLDGSGGITNIKFDDCCCDGMAVISPSGGVPPYTYQWNTDSNNDTLSGLCEGNYCVVVIDANGCYAVECIDIINLQNDFEITGLTLMYEDTIGEIGPLTPGLIIDRDELCRFNVRADFCGQVQSIKFLLNGNFYRTENILPFAIAGDNPQGFYNVWSPPVGNYTITAIPYPQAGANGTAGTPFTVSFSVIDNVAGTTTACTQPPCPADVTITQKSLPDFCQGTTLFLEANSTNAATYLWSNGSNKMNIPGDPETNYAVTVTTSLGCNATDNLTTTALKDLLSAYVIMSTVNVEMTGATVHSGGVGVVHGASFINLNNGTTITAPGTFTGTNNLTVAGGSIVTNQLPAPTGMMLPMFEYNMMFGGANVNVPANANIVLTGSIYSLVQIGANTTVTFTEPEINIDALVSAENVTIALTNECNILKIKDELSIGMNNIFNADSLDVILFVENNAIIAGQSTVIADIYTLDSLKVQSGTALNPTNMIGMFITETTIAEAYSHWYSNPICHCELADRVASKMFASNTTMEGNTTLKAYPNPFSDKLNIEFILAKASQVRLEIFDISGRKLATLLEGNINADELQKVEFKPNEPSRMVIYRLQTEERVYYGKAVMLK